MHLLQRRPHLAAPAEVKSRLIAWNAETETRYFTDVKGFLSVQTAANGEHHVSIPNGTPLDSAGPTPTNDDYYWTLRIQDLNTVQYAGTRNDQQSRDIAREQVRQNGGQVLVKRKHVKEIAVEPRFVALNAETGTRHFTGVKGFLSVQAATNGVHHMSIPNGTPLDSAGPMPTNDDHYWMLRIQDLNTVQCHGIDQQSRDVAREQVRQNGGRVLVQRKHVKAMPEYRIVAWNAETATRNFTDVKAFLSAQEGVNGVYHVSIPNGTPLDSAGAMPANADHYWTLRIQDLNQVQYAGPDQQGRDKAREQVRQNNNQIVVKRKHLKVDFAMAVNAARAPAPGCCAGISCSVQ